MRTEIGFKRSDGGRKKAGFPDWKTRDCVARAIAIATGIQYATVYEGLNYMCYKMRKQIGHNHYAHSGMPLGAYWAYLKAIGWQYVAFEYGRVKSKAKFCREQLPKGEILVHTPKHLCAVMDHVRYDSGRGNLCKRTKVIGYFVRKQRKYRK